MMHVLLLAVTRGHDGGEVVGPLAHRQQVAPRVEQLAHVGVGQAGGFVEGAVRVDQRSAALRFT